MLKKVAEKVKELNPSYADIIALRYYYQYEDVEISHILEIKPENVRTKLHRARQSLIKLLAKEKEAIYNESTRIS